MQTAAERIVEWALGIESDDIPDEVCAQAKLHILDTLGCGLAAHATGGGWGVRPWAASAGVAVEP